MSEPVAVVTDVSAYHVAIGELPIRTLRSENPADAIVVVSGAAGWCDAVRAAAHAGAAAIVVSQPAAVAAKVIRSLAADVGSVPVLAERPFLRADAASDARSGRAVNDATVAARLVTADCAANPAEFETAIRDAVGWLRVLAGGALALRAGAGGAGLFEREDAAAPPALLTAVTVAGRSTVRAYALGEVLSEVDVTNEHTTVATSTVAGRLVAPSRYESPQRLALRRALDALAGDGAGDLDDLGADSALAEAVLQELSLPISA